MKFDHAPFDPFISVSADTRRFVNAPATRDAIARRKDAQRLDADVIGGRSYRVDLAGEGTAEMYWDALIAEARLLQLPDLFDGEWINSGGHYDRRMGEWFNTEGATGIPISVLRDVVLGRIIELNLTKETVDKYITRKGRTIAEEEAFYQLPFNARINALRSGVAL
jgi:hypothetical protein